MIVERGVGGVLWAAALLLLAVEGFSGLAVFNELAGLGSSLLSGADLALLYDSERLLAGDQPERPNRAARNLFVIGMGLKVWRPYPQLSSSSMAAFRRWRRLRLSAAY